MKIVCPSCNAEYNIPQSKIPAKKSAAACNRCGARIVFDPETNRTGPSDASEPAPEPTAPHRIAASVPAPAAALSAAYADYPQLRQMSAAQLDISQILTENKKGGFRNRKNKRKVKILRAVAPLLDKVLVRGERIMRVAKGIAYYPLELLLGGGVLTMLYNHYAILCTDRRVLLVNTTYRMRRPAHYLFQIPYGDMKKIVRGWIFTNLTFKRRTGKKRIFNYVDRFSLKELSRFIGAQIEKCQAAEQPPEPIEDLCPACCLPLAKGLNACPQCRTAFKRSRTAFIRSLILPGWGDLYLGHRALGLLELLGSAVVWLVVIGQILTPGIAHLMTALLIVFIYNGLDALLALHMAKKGYMAA